MDCCCPVNLAYAWSSYCLLDGYYSGSNYNAFLGRGKNATQYLIHPPLLETGGTTIPKQGDWVFLCQGGLRGYGILADGSLWGWGQAPLGDGTQNDSIFPKKISAGPWKKVSTSDTHTAAIKQDGTLWTWGSRDCSGDNTELSGGIIHTPRAVLSSSIVSLLPLDVTVAIEWGRVAYDTVTPQLQPSSVNVVKDYYGSGAAVSCVIWYQIDFNDWWTATYRQWGVFSSPPSVIVTADSRDSQSKQATFRVTLDNDGRVESMACTYPGEYLYVPSISISGQRPDGSSFVASFKQFGMKSIRVDVGVVSGGTGYSHRIESPIRVTVVIPGQSERTVAYANLSPSSVVRVEAPEGAYGGNGIAYVGNGSLYMNDLTCTYLYENPNQYGTFNTPYLFSPVDYSSIVPQASLVSYEDDDFPLTMTPVDARNGVWTVKAPPVIPNRKSTGYVRITWPSFTYPQAAGGYSVYVSGSFGSPTPSSQPNVDTRPYLYLDGTPQLYCQSGNWSIVDSIAGGAAAVCTAVTPETYTPYSQDPALSGSYKNLPYTPSGPYQSGPPLHPLKEDIIWGKRSQGTYAQDAVFSPEYTYSRTVPELTQWLYPSVSFHNRKRSPSPVTLLVFSNNVEGSGLACSGSWSFTKVATHDKSSDEYSLSYQVTNGGSGYVYEPSVFATSDILTPQRVGDKSNWTDVACKEYQTSGISGGWPYSWGSAPSAVSTMNTIPTAVGFGIDINHSSTDSLFSNSLRSYGQDFVNSPLLKPHTAGTFNASGRSSGFFFAGNPDLWTRRFQSFATLSVAESLTRALSYYHGGSSLQQWDGVYYPPAVAALRIQEYIRTVPSRYFGVSSGLYGVRFPDSVKSLLPGGAVGYQHFVPVQYSRDLFSPIQLTTGTSPGVYQFSPESSAGACYTSSPGDLGNGKTATLYAPNSFRKLFYYQNNLYAVSDNSELWLLSQNSANPHPTSRQLTEQDKVGIKGWKVDQDVTWSWSTDTTDVSVMVGPAGAYYPTNPETVVSLGTYSHTYLTPPAKSTEGGAGYVDLASFFPATQYKVVITNPGSGYRPGDSLSFTLKNASLLELERSSTFNYVSHESQTTSVETPVIEYTSSSYPYGRVTYRADNYSSAFSSGWGWGSSGASAVSLNGKPYPKPYFGHFASANPVLLKESRQASYIKSVKAKLKDEVTFQEHTAASVSLNEWPFSISCEIRDGGIYMKDNGVGAARPSVTSNSLNNLILVDSHGSRSGDFPSVGSWANVLPFYSKMPSVEVSGGSGTGATAAIVPAGIPFYGTGAYWMNPPPNNFRPFCFSQGLKNIDVVLKDCSVNYGISNDGSLRPYGNPFVQAPASHPSGFAKVDGSVGLTSNGDAYFLFPQHETSYYNAYYNYYGYSTGLSRPVAVPNVEYTIADPGSRYTLTPLIKVEQSSPDVAVVDAVLDGKLVSLGVDEGGYGYRFAPTLSLSGGGGSGAAAEAVISGPIAAVILGSGGGGYKAVPRVAFSNMGVAASATASARGYVTSIVLADGGDGYAERPSVLLTGGEGTGASAEAVMKKRVAFVRITSRSGLFSSPPKVTFTGGSATDQAEAEAVCQFNSALNKFYVSSIRVTYKGEGYASVPAVVVTPEKNDDGSTSTVAATAEMDQYVSSLTLTGGGQGYSSPPGVTIIGQSKSGAKAFAMLSMSVADISLVTRGQYRLPPSISFETSGTLHSISLTSGGSGYKTPPRVVVVDTRGLGTGATAACVINKSGSVTSVVVTSVGSGYDVDLPPSVVFVGGEGSGASATASVEMSGSGASASCYLNASILYATVTNPGSGYQFSPKVAISGGGNDAVAEANSLFQSGAISNEERVDQIQKATGRIQSRIEGVISRFDIVNPGNFYCKFTSGVDGPNSFSWPFAGTGAKNTGDITQIFSDAMLIGQGARSRGEVVRFEATTTYPGGPISQPLSMPTSKFFQKPKVIFSNSQVIDVQEFKQSKRTSNGTRSQKTYPSSTVFPVAGYLGITPAIKNNLIFSWRDPSSGAYRVGWTGVLFEQGKFPTVVFSSESGSGMTASATLNSDGSVQSVSISVSADNYGAGSNGTTIDIRQGVLRHDPCAANCVVSAQGEIISINVSSGGRGYISPAVIIHDGGGGGALASATVSGGVIQSISVDSRGKGYSASSPPIVLVYETSGYFSESPIGQAFRQGLKSALSDRGATDYPISWAAYKTEYSPPISHADYGSSAADWSGEGASDLNEDRFGYLTEVVSLTCNSHMISGRLNKTPYSSPPAVTVLGDCDRPLSVTSSVVKWKDVFSNNSGRNASCDVCGIRKTN